MSDKSISVENLGQELSEIVSTCDALELESVITQLESVLRLARKWSDAGTRLDQSLYKSSRDETWNKPIPKSIVKEAAQILKDEAKPKAASKPAYKPVQKPLPKPVEPEVDSDEIPF